MKIVVCGLWSVVCCLLLAACPGSLFEEISTQFASPIAVAVDTANSRAYVVNSNNNYDYTNTTLSILDITNPKSPTLLSSTTNPISIPNFSGEIYLDVTNRLAYIPNRLSTDDTDEDDLLLRVNLNEASETFGTVDSYSGGENPFGITYSATSERIYVTTNDKLLVYDPSNLATSTPISFEVTLDSGTYSGSGSAEVVILGSQAFVSHSGGRIYVINTGEVADSSKTPIDYVLLDGGSLRGIATDGTSIFAVDGTIDATVLRFIDPSTLIAIDPDVSTIAEKSLESTTDAVQVGTVSVGTDPQQVVVLNGKAYVTNLGDDTVTVIDIATKAVTTTITVQDEPFGMAPFTDVASGTNYIYVTNLKSNSVSIINADTNALVTNFAP